MSTQEKEPKRREVTSQISPCSILKACLGKKPGYVFSKVTREQQPPLSPLPWALPAWDLLWPTVQRPDYLLASCTALLDSICHVSLEMNVDIPRAGSAEGLPDLTHEKELYCSQTPNVTVFHKKALAPYSWLCANKEVGQNLWMLPQTCHSTVKTIFETVEKQKKWSWVCTDAPCDSITFLLSQGTFPGRE